MSSISEVSETSFDPLSSCPLRSNVYMVGGFAPVRDEVYETDLVVQGTMPAAMAGAFVRVGPNPYYDPLGDYHLFGEGAIVLTEMSFQRGAS